MSSEAVIERSRADIEAGQLWKARERLGSYLRTSPADQPALDLMGQVLYLMRDLPNAARYWQLTDRTGPDVTEAMAAFEQRHRRNPVAAYRALPTKGMALDAYPPSVEERVRGLRAAAFAVGHRDSVAAHRSAGLGSSLLAFVVAAVFVGSFIVGLITIIVFVAKAIA